MAQNALDVIPPAMKVDDEINRARFAKPFGDENRHGAVRVMLLGRIKLVFVMMALGALGMREWGRWQWFEQ